MGERFDCEERMMGVYIKGMEMPMYWYECPFCSDGYCFMIQDGDDRICLVGSKEDTHRNENCPLIEIPPHGRLIIKDGEIVEES